MKRKKLNEVKIGDTLYCIARGQNGSVDIVPLTAKNVITNGPIIDLGIYSKEAIIIKEKVPNSPEAEGQFVIDQYYRGDECFSSKYGIYTTYEEAYQDAIEELKEEHQNYQVELKNLVKREESVMNSLVSLLKSPKTSKSHENTESEDERIRKEIICLIEGVYKGSITDYSKAERDRYVAYLEKQGEQKPAWSEEDESWFKELELMALSFSNNDSYRKKFFGWLKSLKDRVQPQSHWKPSEGQIKALRWILNNIPYNIHKEEISGLFEQLEAL